MSVGEKIKGLRVSKKLSQPQCAKRVGVSTKTWMRWEQGEPPERVLPMIARALGVTEARLTGAAAVQGEDALRTLRAVAATFELLESDLTADELKHFRAILAGYVGLLEQMAFGKEAAVVLPEDRHAVRQALAEIATRLLTNGK